MPPQGITELTDHELRQFATDPRVTAAHIAKLTDGERARLQSLKQGESGGDGDGGTVGKIGRALKTTARVGSEAVTGAAQGVGQSVFNAGKMGHSMLKALPGSENIPGVGGTEGKTVFDSQPDILEPKSTAAAFTKKLEQVAEYLIPAVGSRKAAVSILARLIPNGASPAAMKTLNKVAAHLGRTVGEGASATGVAALHGEQNPEHEGAIAAAGPAVGGVLAQAARTLPITGPLAAGVGAAQALGPLGLGMVGGLSLSNQVRGMVKRATGPKAVKAVQRRVRQHTPQIMRGAAGAEEQRQESGPQRKRLTDHGRDPERERRLTKRAEERD